MQSFGDGGTETTYLRYGSDSGVEPLVINRDFFGIRPRYNELIEEFRHLHNLCDSGDGRLFQIGDDGSELVAAEVTPERVRVLTRLLRSFQAVPRSTFCCSRWPLLGNFVATGGESHMATDKLHAS